MYNLSGFYTLGPGTWVHCVLLISHNLLKLDMGDVLLLNRKVVFLEPIARVAFRNSLANTSECSGFDMK